MSSASRHRVGRRTAARLVAAVVVAFCAIVAHPQPADAHAALVRSDPAASATMAEPPSTVRLWFKEAVVADATVVEVTNSDSAVVDTRSNVESGQPELVVVDLPPSVPDGVYIVRWQVLSDADGHVTRGVLAFGIGAGADPSTAALGRSANTAATPDVVLRWLNFLTLAAVFGPLAVALAVLGRRRWRELPGAELAVLRRTAQTRLLGWAALAAGMAAFIGVAMAARDIRSLTSDVSAPPDASATELLFGTRWGALWLARELMLVVAAGCVILLRRTLRAPWTGHGVRRVAAGAAIASAVAIAVIQSLRGHAAAVDTAPVLAVTADAAHLVAAACWIGGLAALASLGGGLRRPDSAGTLAREAWRSFGPLAATAVAVLAITGLYGLAGEVASLDAALTTTYGQALLGKSALFAVMGLAGLSSAAALHPAVARRVAIVLGRLAHRAPTLVSMERPGHFRCTRG